MNECGVELYNPTEVYRLVCCGELLEPEARPVKPQATFGYRRVFVCVPDV